MDKLKYGCTTEQYKETDTGRITTKVTILQSDTPIASRELDGAWTEEEALAEYERTWRDTIPVVVDKPLWTSIPWKPPVDKNAAWSWKQ